MDFSKIAFGLSAAVLVFLYGVAVGVYEIFPYRILRGAQDAVEQVYAERFNLTGTRPIHFLNRARHDGSGVTHVEADRMQPGLTLISGFFDDSSEIRLLEPDGTLVNRWPVSFSTLFPDPQHIQPRDQVPATDWNTDIHGVVALPDGSIVFNFEFDGMARLDRCGSVTWTLPRMTHHSVERAAGGGFWVPGRRYVTQARFPSISLPHYEDTVMRVSDDGRVVDEFSVPELLFAGGLGPLLLSNGAPELLNGIPDLGHLNDIEELSAEAAVAYPDFSAGDLLLSLRNLNLVMVVDPQTRTIKWHQIGPWLRQHDPDFELDGSITVFNNNSTAGSVADYLGGSNIIAMNPVTRETRKLFESTPDDPFFTPIRGKQQLLANGDILLTEFAAGRIMEVNNTGHVVWEFINRYDDENVAEVSQAIRYPADYFTVADWTCDSAR